MKPSLTSPGRGSARPWDGFTHGFNPGRDRTIRVCRAQRPTSEAVAAEREGVFDPGQAQAGRRAGEDPGDEDPGRGEVDRQVGVVEMMRLQRGDRRLQVAGDIEVVSEIGRASCRERV